MANDQIVNQKDVDALLASFPLIQKIHRTYGNPPNWKRPEGFETLVLIILEQQVSLSSAKAHFEKLRSYVNEMAPHSLLKLDDQEFRDNYISRQKASYLRALSTAVNNGELTLEGLSNLTEKEARAQLTSIKGIGNWTADVYLMTCLQFKDIFPIGDVALVNTMRELTDNQTKEEILEYSERWKPKRSLVTYYLWHYYLSKRGRTLETIG